MSPVVNVSDVQVAGVHGKDDDTVRWAGGFALPALLRHDFANVGTETPRGVAFFAGPTLTQEFDDVMLPPNSHTLRSPNATGQTAYEGDAR